SSTDGSKAGKCSDLLAHCAVLSLDGSAGAASAAAHPDSECAIRCRERVMNSRRAGLLWSLAAGPRIRQERSLRGNMMDVPSTHYMERNRVQAEEQRQVVLVFQGGGALGAYQAGVYQALHESGIEPDWVMGTSIGAINASLIAGNEPRNRESPEVEIA